MNEEAKKQLERICQKELIELTVHDKAFLRARSSYLGRGAKKKFAEVLGLDSEVVQAELRAEAEGKPEQPAENPFVEENQTVGSIDETIDNKTDENIVV